MASSVNEIEREIRRQLREKGPAEVERKAEPTFREIKAYAESISPVESGEYKRSFRMTRKRGKDDMPARRLRNIDGKANMIEDGTVDTPEFAVLARTAAHFGGTPDRS